MCAPFLVVKYNWQNVKKAHRAEHDSWSIMIKTRQMWENVNYVRKQITQEFSNPSTFLIMEQVWYLSVFHIINIYNNGEALSLKWTFLSSASLFMFLLEKASDEKCIIKM